MIMYGSETGRGGSYDIGNPLKVVALRRFAASTDATKLFNGNCTVYGKSNVRIEDDHILKKVLWLHLCLKCWYLKL